MAAVSVSLYNFSKKKNSTKRPASAGSSYSCLLKEGTDKWSPTFILSGDPSAYNYCSAWGLYYYVDRMEYQPPHWHLTCTLDPLASWKTEVGAASLYVTRANSTTQWDRLLIDNVPTQSAPSSVKTDFGSVFNSVNTGGYVVSIAGSTSSTGCTHYTFDPVYYRIFAKQFMDPQRWDLSSLLSDIGKDMVRPLDYIKDIRWYPIWNMGMLPTFSRIYIGGWDTGATGVEMSESDYVYSPSDKTITIPKHPQGSTHGEYLNSALYTRHTFVDPCFGIVPIDANSISGYTSLVYHLDVDMSCGFGHMRLKATASGKDDVILADREAEIGVSVLFSNVSHGVQNMVADGMNAGLSLGTGNILGAVSGIMGVAQAAFGPKMGTTGSIGSRAMFQYHPELYTEFMTIDPIDPVTQGYPVCKTLTISSLSGFVQVAKGDVAIAGPSWAADQIRSYLEGGFYYE